jgi:hypothetical protein
LSCFLRGIILHIMQSGAAYRLKASTIGAVTEPGDAHPVPVTIPAGAVLTLMDSDVGRTGYVRVLWNSRMVTMFSVDLIQRGEPADGAGLDA